MIRRMCLTGADFLAAAAGALVGLVLALVVAETSLRRRAART
jgi:hypothetical protein